MNFTDNTYVMSATIWQILNTLTGNGSYVNQMKFAWDNLLNHIKLCYFWRVLAI